MARERSARRSHAPGSNPNRELGNEYREHRVVERDEHGTGGRHDRGRRLQAQRDGIHHDQHDDGALEPRVFGDGGESAAQVPCGMFGHDPCTPVGTKCSEYRAVDRHAASALWSRSCSETTNFACAAAGGGRPVQRSPARRDRSRRSGEDASEREVKGGPNRCVARRAYRCLPLRLPLDVRLNVSGSPATSSTIACSTAERQSRASPFGRSIDPPHHPQLVGDGGERRLELFRRRVVEETRSSRLNPRTRWSTRATSRPACPRPCRDASPR